jgi:Tfp pilus assembly protein PilN
MIEFNLLPDVKLEYLKARNIKRIVIFVAVIICTVTVALFIVLLLIVDVAQKVRINNLNTNINSVKTTLTGNTDLNEILTIQHQLQSLPTVEAQVPVASRLFGYINQITPTNATISSLNIDYTANSISISGAADSLATINQFVDTLKFTTYTLGSSTGNQAFNTVILSSFSNGTSGTANSAQYTISFNFDPALFNQADKVTLVVPQITTTRSIISQPTGLFKASSTQSTGSK